MNKNIENKANYISGKAKEAAGKLVHSEQLELEGKLQVLGSEISDEGEALKRKAAQKTNELKEKAAHKANQIIDDIQDNKRKDD